VQIGLRTQSRFLKTASEFVIRALPVSHEINDDRQNRSTCFFLLDSKESSVECTTSKREKQDCHNRMSGNDLWKRNVFSR